MASTTQEPETKPIAWLGRLLRRVIFLFVLFAILVWFAPSLIAITPMRHWVAQQIFSGLKGDIRVGKTSLGWFSPVIAEDVQFHDPDGKEYLTIPHVESEYTLLRLLLDLSDLGPFRCENPRLKIVFAGNKSNLETVLAGYLQPAKTDSGGNLGIDLQVTGAKVEMTDKDLGKTWTLEPVHCFVRMPRDPGGTLQVKLDGRWKDQAKKILAELDWPGWQKPGTGSTEPMKLTLHTEAFPLAMLEPIVRRYDPSLKLEGNLDTSIQGTWSKATGNQKNGNLDALVRISDLAIQGNLLEKEQLRLKEIKLPCRLNITGNQIEIEKADLHCDCGHARLRGKFDLSSEWQATLKQPGCEIEASVDLPRLAALLPKTLRLREDTKLTEGQVKLVVRSATEKSNVIWSGDLQTSKLAGISQGKKFLAQELIAVNFKARILEKGLPHLETLHCKSSFLNAQATSSADQWDIQANYDLDQLVKQFSQFMDFGSLKLGGRGDLVATFCSSGKQVECLKSKLTLSNLICEAPGISIKEPVLQVSTAGKFELESGKLELANTLISSDTLYMTIPKLHLAPVRGGFEVATTAVVKADLQRLQRWVPGATATAPPLAGKLSGNFSLNTKGPHTTGQVELTVTHFVAGEPRAPCWTAPAAGLADR